MKIIYPFVFFAFITLQVFGQRPGDANYNPLKAKLLILQHKANSNTLKNQKIALEVFQLNQLMESVNIYVKYEIDRKYSSDPKSDNLPPKKVMDLDFIYSYTYLIPYSSPTEIDELLPVIELRKGQKLESVKVSNASLSNEKVKRGKIKSNKLLIDTTNRKLTLTIDKSILQDNGFLEIEIEIKTPYFNALLPSFSTNTDFDRSLIISVPSIFKYRLPKESNTFELQSEEKNKFVLLQLNRRSSDWNTIVKEYWTDCITYTYKVNGAKPVLSNVSFEIETIELPVNIDIGVPVRELYIENQQ